MVGRAGLGAQRVQRLGQLVGTPMRDHDGADRVSHRDRRLASSRRARVLFEDLAHVAGRVLALVRAHHVLDAAGHLDGAVVDPHRGLAEPGQELVGVAGEHQDAGALDEALQPRLRLLQEVGVDRADALVEQQDLRVDAGHHAHRQPHPHAGGVRAQRHRQVVAELGELRDLVDLGQHLLARLPEEQAADDDVLVAGDLGVHADAEVEHRGHPAGHRRRPAGGLVDPGQQPQQRRFARAVVADQPDPVAEFQRHRDVPQRLDDDDVGLVASDRAAGLAKERLLQRARLGVEDGKLHPRVVGLDVRDRRSRLASATGTGRSRRRRGGPA